VLTSKGNTWTQQRVGAFRRDHGIAVYRDGERAERGEVTLAEAASRLAVSRMTVIRLIKGRLLPAKQTWIYRSSGTQSRMDVQYQWIRDRELWNINNVGR